LLQATQAVAAPQAQAACGGGCTAVAGAIGESRAVCVGETGAGHVHRRSAGGVKVALVAFPIFL